MKKNRKTMILFILAFISFFLATIEGFIYFGKDVNNLVLRIILTIQNSISAFTFSPSVNAMDVLSTISNEAAIWEWMLLYAYAAALFLAQICTATAVFVAFKTVIIKAVENIQCLIGGKEYITIFGYNEKVEMLLDNISKDNENIRNENKKNLKEYIKEIIKIKRFEKIKFKKEIVVFLVTDKPFDEAEELELAKKHVIWIDADVLALSEKEKEKLVLKLFDSKQMILFEESEMRNFSIYSMFCTDEQLKKYDAKYYLYCEDDGIREVIEQYYTNFLGDIPDLYIFSLAEIKVNKIFKKIDELQWVPDEMSEDDYRTNPSQFDIHLLIVGFGKTGQQMLIQTLNQGVLHSKSRIWIDIVDRNALQLDDLFMKRFHENYIRKTKDEYIDEKDKTLGRCAAYTIAGDECDGELKIRFFEAEVRGKKFQKILDKLVKTEEDKPIFPLTNIMVGFHELDTLASCMMDAKKHATRMYPENSKSIKMFVCADISDNLLKYLNYNDAVNGTKKNIKVEIIETISNKEEICLENIFNRDREELAKSYCYIYNKIYSKLHNEYKFVEMTEEELKKEIDINWNKQSYEDKMSNYALSYHQEIKSKILSTVWKENSSKEREKYFGEQGILLRYKDGNYEHTTEEFIDALKNCPFVEEMIRLEHRRWNYFMALHGWRYENIKEKNREEKAHGCLRSYDILKKDELQKDKVVYDLMPLLYQYEQDLKQNNEKQAV